MKAYKKLRKLLRNRFVNTTRKEYDIVGSIREWMRQSGIKPTDERVLILVTIYGSAFYPYQKKDRKVILKYLKENKKWIQ